MNAEPERKQRQLSEVAPADLRAATDEVKALVAERFPTFYTEGQQSSMWPLIAGGFVTRSAAILDSLTVLAERHQTADAVVLLRVLFDHATTFCWLAINPPEHMTEWMGWADHRQRALHNDAMKYGVEVLSADELAALNPIKPPSMLDLAEAVDAYWPDRLSAFRPHPDEGPMHILTFRGFYTAVFRRASGLVHSSPASVERHVWPSKGRLHVGDERAANPPDYPAFGLPLVAFILLVYERHFDWPDEQRVRSISESMLYQPPNQTL